MCMRNLIVELIISWIKAIGKISILVFDVNESKINANKLTVFAPLKTEEQSA